MSIKINNSILYNESDGTLTQVDNTESKVVLIRSTSRLLSFFIENNNQLVLRERLISEVLVEYGLKASNNNLNNYISVLRKSLAQLGEYDIIVTYPRQGFKFIATDIECDDSIKPCTGSNTRGGGTQVNRGVNENTLVGSKENERVGGGELHKITSMVTKMVKRKKALKLTLIIATFFVAPLVYYFVSLSERPISTAMYLLYKYDNCQVYSNSKVTDMFKHLPQIIKRTGFDCKSKANVYYYKSVKEVQSKNATELVIFCPLDVKTPCINSYLSHNKQM
ncbi:winged helix-turn-helix domain-containing protein [Serratia nevei]|uniref:winged helix-turn-helix domain-containing protein n=1 Tax=Serratia nevei TaxID=2703794 RepID=UPI003FA78C3C